MEEERPVEFMEVVNTHLDKYSRKITVILYLPKNRYY